MIGTTSDDAPPLDAVRCVPRAWAVPTTMEPTPVWDDSGGGGRPGSLWRVNAEGMMGVTQRHHPPPGPHYSLKEEEFFINPADDSPAGLGHEQAYDVKVEDPGFTFSSDWIEVWNSAGCGADADASVWRPRLVAGMVFFGDFAHASRWEPSAAADVLVSADHPAMLACVEKYELEWLKKRGKKHFYGWRPIPPSPDFVALGHIVTTNKSPPDLPQFRCVHRGLLMARSMRRQRQLWTDKGSWVGDDGSLWHAPPPCGTFIVKGKAHEPPAGLFYTLDTRFVPTSKFEHMPALRDFDAEDKETQISFKAGEVLVVTFRMDGDPWWSGFCEARPEASGTFPGSCLEG
jgi:hypothetical protein